MVITFGVIVFTYPLLPKTFSVLDPAHFLRAPFLVMTVIVCTLLSFFFWGGGKGGVEPPTKFSKKGGALTGPQFSEEDCWKRGGNFFRKGRGGGVAIFTKKVKLKCEVFNDKKVYKQKYFSLS